MPGRQKCEQWPLKGRQWFGKSGWRYGWYTWDTSDMGDTPAIQKHHTGGTPKRHQHNS